MTYLNEFIIRKFFDQIKLLDTTYMINYFKLLKKILGVIDEDVIVLNKIINIHRCIFLLF